MSQFPNYRPQLRKERCETCKFHAGSTCRRRPPAFHEDYTDFAAWPAVGPNGWCGEYAPKKQEV